LMGDLKRANWTATASRAPVAGCLLPYPSLPQILAPVSTCPRSSIARQCNRATSPRLSLR